MAVTTAGIMIVCERWVQQRMCGTTGTSKKCIKRISSYEQRVRECDDMLILQCSNEGGLVEHMEEAITIICDLCLAA